MFDENRHAALRKELADYQKCVDGNPARFLALTDFSGIDGYDLDPECCARIPVKTIHRIMESFMLGLIDEGYPIKGGKDAWSVGSMGSRWLDMNAELFGITYIRAAFYSKKHFKGEWPSQKPYMIRITCEQKKA